jgi:hypothetical protein
MIAVYPPYRLGNRLTSSFDKKNRCIKIKLTTHDLGGFMVFNKTVWTFLALIIVAVYMLVGSWLDRKLCVWLDSRQEKSKPGE